MTVEHGDRHSNAQQVAILSLFNETFALFLSEAKHSCVSVSLLPADRYRGTQDKVCCR